MEKLFRVILEMGITAVPVILAVFAIRMCLLRAPKRYSYLLWGIAGFRLAVPFSVSSALSIFNLGFFRGTSIGRNIAQPGMGEAFGGAAGRAWAGAGRRGRFADSSCAARQGERHRWDMAGSYVSVGVGRCRAPGVFPAVLDTDEEKSRKSSLDAGKCLGVRKHPIAVRYGDFQPEDLYSFPLGGSRTHGYLEP